MEDSAAQAGRACGRATLLTPGVGSAPAPAAEGGCWRRVQTQDHRGSRSPGKDHGVKDGPFFTKAQATNADRSWAACQSPVPCVTGEAVPESIAMELMTDGPPHRHRWRVWRQNESEGVRPTVGRLHSAGERTPVLLLQGHEPKQEAAPARGKEKHLPCSKRSGGEVGAKFPRATNSLCLNGAPGCGPGAPRLYSGQRGRNETASSPSAQGPQERTQPLSSQSHGGRLGDEATGPTSPSPVIRTEPCCKHSAL